MITTSIIRQRRKVVKDSPPCSSNGRSGVTKFISRSFFRTSTSDKRSSRDGCCRQTLRSRFSAMKNRTSAKDAPSRLSNSMQATSQRSSYSLSRPSTPINSRGSTTSEMSSPSVSPTPRQSPGIKSLVMIDEPNSDDAYSTLSGDEESSEGSSASLLKSWSVDGSSSSEASRFTSLEKTLRRFEARDKTSIRFLSGKPDAYREMILSNEMACRKKTLAAMGCSSRTDRGVILPELPPARATRLSNEDSLLQLLKKTVLFERHHSLESVSAALWYCIGHFSLFNTVETLSQLVLKASGLGPCTFYGFLILLGLSIMRINGYLWNWLCPESYRLVKFDMHNRAKLGFWDARILTALKRPPFSDLNRIVSMLSFYFLYIGAQFYYHKVVDSLENVFWMFQQRLEKQVVGVIEIPTGTLPCDAFHFIEVPTFANKFAHYFCVHYQGDPESILPSVALYILFATVAAISMARAGGSLFEL